jgi:signal transduction histidine kinase
MKQKKHGVAGQPALYLGLMFLIISAQLFWWILFFTEIRFALHRSEEERDRVLEMALNGDPIPAVPPYFRFENGRYRIDSHISELRRQGRDRNIVMILAEATFFLTVFGVISVILLRLYRSTQQLAREQELFLNSFTHELKTPLAAIKLNLQTLKKRPDHTAVPELVDGSLREVEILNRKISEILRSSELSSGESFERGSAEAQFFPVLERTLGELQSLLLEQKAAVSIGYCLPVKGYFPALFSTGHQIPEPAVEQIIFDETGIQHDNLTTMQSLDECRLDIEPRELGSVIGELIMNALLYSGQSARIRIRFRQKGQRMQFFFMDDGPGIPYSERENIFRPMVRLQRQSSFVPGTGMGLANVRALLRRRGGRIILLPSVKGACFLVEIGIAGIIHLDPI